MKVLPFSVCCKYKTIQSFSFDLRRSPSTTSLLQITNKQTLLQKWTKLFVCETVSQLIFQIELFSKFICRLYFQTHVFAVVSP